MRIPLPPRVWKFWILGGGQEIFNFTGRGGGHTMLGQVRNTKLGTNVFNEILVNSAKCQGYSFYCLWIIMGSPFPPPKTTTQIRVKLPNKNDFLKGFQPSNSKNIFQCWNFQRVTFSESISINAGIFREWPPNYTNLVRVHIKPYKHLLPNNGGLPPDNGRHTFFRLLLSK